MTTKRQDITSAETGTKRKNPSRPLVHFTLGDAHASKLDCLSPSNAATAIATGTMELRGKHANRSPGKAGHCMQQPAVYMSIQTNKEMPRGLQEPVQESGNFIGLTSEAAADWFLGHFMREGDTKLTVADVRVEFGEPDDDKSIHLDLFDILDRCCDEIECPKKSAVATA